MLTFKTPRYHSLTKTKSLQIYFELAVDLSLPVTWQSEQIMAYFAGCLTGAGFFDPYRGIVPANPQKPTLFLTQ